MPTKPDLALAVIRIATGGVFVVHGWQKIFTTGLAGVTRLYAQVGVPLPLLVAPVTATLELLGGLLLVVGLGARGLAGLLGALTVLVGAARLLHGQWPATGIETAVLLIAGCAAVVLGGPGQPSALAWGPAAPVSGLRPRPKIRR